MGTKALVIINEDHQSQSVTQMYSSMYCQYDGYLEGVGEQIKDFLKDRIVVNGLSGSTISISNGMGCLAASFVSHVKKDAGGWYMTPNKNVNSVLSNDSDVFVDFVYVISKNYIRAYCLDYDGEVESFRNLFKGSWLEYNEFLNKLSKLNETEYVKIVNNLNGESV